MNETNHNPESVTTTVMMFAGNRDEAALAGEKLTRLGYSADLVRTGGMSAAVDWCREQPSPQALFVDIDGDAAPLQTLAELLAVCDPECSVVVVGSQQDVNLYRTLLQNGAFEYLLKPASFDLFADTLTRALANDDFDAQLARVRSGRTIAVTGAVGGCGTSTVVASLAQALATRMNIPSAVVDFDRLNATQALLLGHEGDAGLAAALASEEIDSRFLQRSMAQVNERLALLAQQPDADPVIDFPEEQVLEMGASLCRLYNQIVWDLPASRPYGSTGVMTHAQTRIIVTELSVAGARNTYRLLREFGNESAGQQLLLVANAAHGEASTVVEQEQFEQFVERKLDLVLPFAGKALGASLLAGPLSLTAVPEFAAAINNLAALACGQTPQSEESTGPKLVSRLRSILKRPRRAA